MKKKLNRVLDKIGEALFPRQPVPVKVRVRRK
jgi:hypothetical protein